MEKKFNEAINNLSTRIYNILNTVPDDVKFKTNEIRLRLQKPIILQVKGNPFFLDEFGNITEKTTMKTFIVQKDDITDSLNKMCNYSVYSYQNQIKNGYITLKGGHRVGLCGTAVFNDKDKSTIANIRDIFSMNIRIAKTININVDNIINNLNGATSGILIVGPPACGKTTILRNVAKKVSLTYKHQVAVIDERGELSGSYLGISQIDLGHCDILNGYTKNDGIMHAVRALAPDIIICDEIGTKKDVEAIKYGVNSGVKFIASIHAGNLRELLKKMQLIDIFDNEIFNTIIMLKGRDSPGEIAQIFTQNKKSYRTDKCVEDSWNDNFDKFVNSYGVHIFS